MPEHEHPLDNPETTTGCGHQRSATPIDQEPIWLLGELASELSTATTFKALQRILTRKLRWILDFDRCTLALQSQPLDTEYLLFDITRPSIAEGTFPQKIPLDEGWPGRVIIESKPYFLADLSQLPPSVILPRNASVGIAPKACFLMLLPLRVGERTVGSLNFSSNKPGAYSISWRNLACLLAAQVAAQLGSVLAHEQTSLALKNLALSQAQLKSAYEFRERMMESATEAIYTLDLEGNFTLVNLKTAEMTGYSVEELLGFPFKELFSPVQTTDIQKHLLAIISHGVSINQYDAELIRKNGSRKNITFSLAPIFLKGKISAVVGTAQDITLRKQAEERLRLLESVVVNANDAVLITEAEPINEPGPRIFYANEAFTRMTGYSLESVLGKTPRMLQGPKTDRAALDKIRAALETWQPVVVELINYRKDGSEFWVELSIFPVADKSGWYTHWVSVQRDVTERKWSESALLRAKVAEAAKLELEKEIIERKRAEEQLLHSAFHDALTGLPNRALFMDRLEHALKHAKRHEDYLFAVLFLDLDRFKVINDSLGHTFGDQLLIAIANRLTACLRPTSTAARLGGDEFTILLEGINDISDAIKVADRIQKELTLPFELGGQEVFIAASIGIALNASGYDRPEDLLRDADTAMYRAKVLGKARYEIFNPDMHARAVARLQLETALRRAIERQEFRIHYQPIVSLETGRITGFEALVRWQHPQHGLVSPAEFILVAEETGLIIPIDRWVLTQACRQTRRWQEQFPNNLPLTISVNLGRHQFAQPDLIKHIDQILQDTGLDAHSLKLEITESVIMENGESATTKLEQLRDLAVQLSIDDFGTGYSSLERLHRFPINELKIDRSFVSGMGIEPGNLELTETIVTLAQKLGMAVTAEGVETKEQLAQLRAWKCEYGQGYFFSQPLDSEAASALIVANPQW